MTPSEYLLAQALRTCKMDLSGNGRRKLLPPELNHGVLFSFNGHQSIGDYMASLDELLNAVKLDLMETRGKWSIEVALELADLDSTLKHRSKAVLHEAERPALEPNQRNSLICNRSRGLHFTLGLQFGIVVLRGFFTNMRFISLCFTGNERKSQKGRNRT